MCESRFAVMTVEESPREVGPQHCRGPQEAIEPIPQPPEVNGLARLWDCDTPTYSKSVWGCQFWAEHSWRCRRNRTQWRKRSHLTEWPFRAQGKAKCAGANGEVHHSLPSPTHTVIWPTCRSDLYVLIKEDRSPCGRHRVIM